MKTLDVQQRPTSTLLKRVLTPLSSLRITVTLIVFTLLLVFAGTTAQKDMGSWDVQRDFFYAWFASMPLKYFFPLTSLSDTLPGRVPLLGGYTIALAMLTNLFAAHILKFKITWRDLLTTPPLVALVWYSGYLTAEMGYYVLSAVLVVASLPLIASAYWLHGVKRGGVVLIHLGLILMLGGELATSVVKVEQVMPIDEGGYANYAFDTRYAELAVIDRSNPEKDKVAVIDHDRLARGGTVTHAGLPFIVKIDAFYPNSTIVPIEQAKSKEGPSATQGVGLRLVAESLAKADGIGQAPQDVPSAYVTLTSPAGQDLGRYVVSEHLKPQQVTVDGKTFDIALRWPRHYKPFQLHLIDFRFDRHTGTNEPRNYSSLVRLVDPERGEDREVKIWMNHPLRHRGETFYQSSFDNATERRTFLQVVRNPSWLFPYIACVVGGLGMLAHFGLNLREFARKRAKVPTAQAVEPAGGKSKRNQREYTLPPRYGLSHKLVPAAVIGFCVVYLIGVLAPRSTKTPGGIDLKEAASIPMNYNGRVLPYDTMARISLKVITGGKEDLRILEDKPKPTGMQFLFDALTQNRRALDYQMFKIDNAEVVSLMGLEPINKKDGTERQYFSLAEMEPKLRTLQQEVIKLKDVAPKTQTAYQREVNELWSQVKTFDVLSSVRPLHLMPPTEKGGEWRSIDEVAAMSQPGGPIDPALEKFSEVILAYGEGDPAKFDKAVSDYKAHVATVAPKESFRAGVEVFFNRVAPFFHLMGFYVLAFVLVMLSYLFAPGPLRRAAVAVLLMTVVLHTGGLIFRMYLQGRPPVTTLYSSAVFIAWGILLLALGLEYFFKNGIGALAAAVNGFLSLFVAHNLASTDGDTLRPLQAVLDTNFWLATHVVLITLGYAATFLAGAIGIFYVIRGVFTSTLRKDASKELLRMVYGILCFAMLFSFVGTVLGGIWADQSWGRFWGWDPKENGAILIVLWNALILHSRWGGLVKERGVMLLAIFGNVVTAWSYFGTNELGIGLHAYGFTEGRRFWLGLFALSQVSFIALGGLPLAWWRSNFHFEAAARAGASAEREDREPLGRANPATN